MEKWEVGESICHRDAWAMGVRNGHLGGNFARYVLNDQNKHTKDFKRSKVIPGT